MEDDDEFGDLYTDVLRPFTMSFPPQPPPPPLQPSTSVLPPHQSRAIDLNTRKDDEGSLVVASDSSNKSQFLMGGSGSEVGVSGRSGSVKLGERAFGDLNPLDESGIDVVVEERDEKDDVLMETNKDLVRKSESVDKLTGGSGNFGIDEADTGVRDAGLDTTIPGLSKFSGSVAGEENLIGVDSGMVKEHSFDNSEPTIPGISDGRDKGDSESDSEDDLQILLNDDMRNERNVLVERSKMMGGNNYVDDDEDEDEDPLVILNDKDVNNKQLMEEQEWAGEAADGDRKELDDAAKASGGVAVAPKIGYSNHGYHPYHSQFKYVRPGAAPMPGTTSIVPGGTPCQVRPPVNIGPIAGRGRGDWRPAGVKNAPAMQKGFHTGFGMPSWGSNPPGHGFGSGLEFTLPSHKTVFEVDIDGFEEKPWRLPGIDISDYFNFGLNEETWKEYCKKLELLRLEATMQSKIRVYESGRTEQEYDPDMPPELAAAAGIHEVPPETAALVKMDAGLTDLVKGPRQRPPLPTGRAIQVESSYGERLPSIDTRPPRIRDSDAIIEIVLQGPLEDDSFVENNNMDRPENGPSGEEFRSENGIEEEVQHEETEHSDSFSHAYDDGRRGSGRRGPPVKPVRDNMLERYEISPIPSESPLECPPDSREQTPERSRSFSIPHEQRLPRARTGHDQSSNMIPYESDNQNEESVQGINGKHSPLQSSPISSRSLGRQVVDGKDGKGDEHALVDENSEFPKDEVVFNTSTTTDVHKDENLMRSSKKQKLSSHVEQPSSQEVDDGEDSKAARSSENSKARSGSSKDFRKSHDDIEDEVVQDGVLTSLRNVSTPISRDEDAPQKSYNEMQEIERHHMPYKVREDSYSYRELDRNSAHNLQGRSDIVDRRKESDNSDGAWQRRNEDTLGRRSRADEAKRREQSIEVGSRRHSKARENERSDREENYQSRKQVENSPWRMSHHDKDVGSRHRDRDDSLKSRNESLDLAHSKRRKDDAALRRDHADKEEIMHFHREISGRRKRERDDVLDQRKKDDQARIRDDEQHYIRQKEDVFYARDKVERHREREEWHRLKRSHEDILSKREREEGRGSRSGRAAEERASVSHSGMKDEHKGSDKEYHSKDVGRHVDQLKRRDRVDNENISHHWGHEDVYARGTQLVHDERRSRHDRASARYDRSIVSSDNHRVHDGKHKDERKKGKEFEDGENSYSSLKRKQEDHGRYKSEMVSLKGTAERASGEHEYPTHRPSSKSHRGDVSSDDEQQDSRRGRSKLERWTSHKERDFSMTIKSASLKFKEVDTHNNGGTSLASKSDEPSRTPDTIDNQNTKSKDSGDPETKNVDVKPMDDKHLDTVAKLKKRSERFKLPLPNEKEVPITKKIESESLPIVQTDNRTESEIKPERPARKRRWTSN